MVLPTFISTGVVIGEIWLKCDIPRSVRWGGCTPSRIQVGCCRVGEVCWGWNNIVCTSVACTEMEQHICVNSFKKNTFVMCLLFACALAISGNHTKETIPLWTPVTIQMYTPPRVDVLDWACTLYYFYFISLNNCHYICNPYVIHMYCSKIYIQVIVIKKGKHIKQNYQHLCRFCPSLQCSHCWHPSCQS